MPNYIRWMAVFDSHGDKLDASASEAMFKFKEEYWKPHETIHGGDNWNFAAIRKGASEEEKEESMIKDFDLGMQFLNRLRPRYLLLGNHDCRLWNLAETSHGLLQDYSFKGCEEIKKQMEKIKCHMLPYDSRHGILEYGVNQKIAHGYMHSDGVAKDAAVTYGNILVGHVHAFSSYRVASIDERVGQTVGCLCDLDMKFESSRKAKLKKEHGWVYGIKNTRTGVCNYWLARKIEDKWILPSSIIEL